VAKKSRISKTLKDDKITDICRRIGSMKNKIMDLFSGTKKVQNKGMKYSVLLERLIAPFEKEFLGSR
jgi:hypothetical protein